MPFMAGRSARYEDNSACQTWMSVTSCKARLMAGNVARAWVRAVSWLSSTATQPPMPHSGWRAMGPGQYLPLGTRERVVKPAGVGTHQRLQRRDPVLAGGQAEFGVGVVQGQGQVVDPGPLGHEAEVSDEHRGLVLEEDVVIPEVAVHQLPRKPGRKSSLACRDKLGKPLGLTGHLPLPGSRLPLPDPGRAGAGTRQHASGFDVVGKLGDPARWGDCMPARRAWIRPRIGSPRASRCGVFIVPLCGMNCLTSSSRPAT